MILEARKSISIQKKNRKKKRKGKRKKREKRKRNKVVIQGNKSVLKNPGHL